MPDLAHGEAPDGYKKEEDGGSSAESSRNTPITASTLSSPGSLSSPSPETAALYRFLSESYGRNRLSLLENGDAAAIPSGHFPREQNLLDLLIQSSGADDLHQLHTMREIRLRVATSVISLSRLDVYAPNVRTLRLDGSSMASLREIGTSLRHLRVLHVSKCGLTCLDGTFGLTSLVELYAAENHITDVSPCAILENLKVINLDRNPIASLSNISLLSLCSKLSKLSLRGTPVSKENDYRRNIRTWMPYLKKLDGVSCNDTETSDAEDDFNKNDNSESCSFEVSSMTGPSSGDYEKSSTTPSENDSLHGDSNQGNIIIHRRPATAIGISTTNSSIISKVDVRRPCTAISRNKSTPVGSSPLSESIPEASSSNLTSGGIFCGNIARALSRARPARRPNRPSSSRPTDDWVIGPPSTSRMIDENQAGCSMTSNDQDVLMDAMDFLGEPLPKRPVESIPFVELEFGVTGSIRDDDSSTFEGNDVSQWAESSQNAIRVSKKWRRAFKLFREQRRLNSTDTQSMDSVDDNNDVT